MPKQDSSILCKNIFKNGKTNTSKDKFTDIWISLINQLEKNKKTIIQKRWFMNMKVAIYCRLSEEDKNKQS